MLTPIETPFGASINVYTIQQQPILFQELWKEQHTLLFLLRSTQCTFCRQHIQASYQYLAKFRCYNTQLIAITDQPVEKMQTFIAELNIPFPVYSDPIRITYQLFGMANTNLIDRLTPSLHLTPRDPLFQTRPNPETINGGVALMLQGQPQPAWTYISQPCENQPSWETILQITAQCQTSYLKSQA